MEKETAQICYHGQEAEDAYLDEFFAQKREKETPPSEEQS